MLRNILLLALFIGLAPAVHADEAGWRALAQPGAIALMRHALAPGTGDPSRFRLDDCSTQRNLDERGRDQAKATGDAIRQRGIANARVVTSQWCRARDTATLLELGPVTELPALNSFFGDRSSAARQTADTIGWFRALDGQERAMLVTHQVNITALTGIVPASGEILVGRLDGENFRVEGRILLPPVE